MGQKFKNSSLKQYLDVLSAREPVPGGGSAAALTGALGAALLSMVTQYSIGKHGSAVIDNKFKNSLRKSEMIRKELLELVDLDAEAYLKVVKARKKSPVEKQKAQKEATRIPKEVCRLCYQAMQLTPFLVEKGNKYLLSDVEVAVEMLLASFNASVALQKAS